MTKVVEDLNPFVVKKLLENIASEDLDLLCMGSSHPRDLIVTKLPVPPVPVRPTVPVGTQGTNEDDLTVKLGDIIQLNSAVNRSREDGESASQFVSTLDALQSEMGMYVNADLPGYPKPDKFVRMRSLVQRLKGKQGRFRGNLSGKRVDFSGRTVISPDPNLPIDRVGVPMWMAMRLTFPEKVNEYNLSRMRQLVRNGPDKYPGAVYIIRNNESRKLKFVDRKSVAQTLRFGDIVERHMLDNDVVLFNRQPSLHRISIMSHRAKVLPWRTLRFNESVCTPYNADFDGDEMNLHLPQTYEAKAEANTLMNSKENIRTPRHGEPLITPTQDFMTASYLLSHKDLFYGRAHFMHLCCQFSDALDDIDIPEPCILKPIELYTGKQLLSVLLRPKRSGIESEQWPLLNVHVKEKAYEKDGFMCPRDGMVLIRNSQLLCGNLAKNSLKGSPQGIVACLLRDHSSSHAAAFMNRVAKLCARWIGNQGFSIGIDDVTPSLRLIERKRQLIAEGYKDCDEVRTIS
jgi:DNA-directed RNA polymerase III subunit RPC1